MFKRRYAMILIYLLGMVLISSAQDAGDIYTFEDGIQFTIPADGVLDDSGSLPMVNLSNAALIDVVEPSVIGETPDATKDLPLVSVLDFLLTAVGYEDERPDDETISMKLLDGREVMAYSFINTSDNYQLLFVIRMSDGRIGALNVRSLEPLTQELVTAIGDLANSFDVASEEDTSEEDTTDNTPIMTDAEAELTADLTQAFAYESGVNFRYPENFVLVNEDSPPVTIGIDEDIIMTMVDPNLIGMPSGETMDAIIDFAIGTAPMSPDDFEPIDVGGRDAVFATVEKDTLFQSMLVVAFADETYGIMDILTLTEPTDEHMEMIRKVAASFNSATSEAGITRADIDEARTLFEDAMTNRDEGEYEAALELFTQALDLNPDFGLAYYWRAATYEQSGQLEEAVADYRKALELEPDQTQIHEDIANAYALYDDMDAAVA